MIINIDAFRKDFDEDDEGKSNLIYRNSEDLSGKKPIELIQQTNTIVIIDEPQSVDNTERSKEAIEKLNLYKPKSILEVSKIPGITPATISILLIYIKLIILQKN